MSTLPDEHHEPAPRRQDRAGLMDLRTLTPSQLVRCSNVRLHLGVDTGSAARLRRYVTWRLNAGNWSFRCTKKSRRSSKWS